MAKIRDEVGAENVADLRTGSSQWRGVHLWVYPNMEAYQKFILSKLSVDENIGQVQSSFVLSKNKYSTALPV